MKRRTQVEMDRERKINEIAKYDPVYRECRDILHAWNILGYFTRKGEPIRKERCVRCGMVKNRNLAPGGYTSYQQPDGYRLPGITRQEFRDFAWQNAEIYETEEDLLEVLYEAEVKSRKRRK